ncbi:SDR family oxidoreductase [Nocardia sp. NBC_01377]|uniref:SDR family NAD(P)-dependent oxidoreductase n=1 Tax=Nocardia sp. NBC_01377 TaxID=2903595 RepID=UPI0032512BEF
MSTSRFRAKTALVTGAASGIGAAIATRLIAEGATVVGIDIAATALDELATVLGPAFVAAAADVTDETAVAAAVGLAADRFGGLDLAFNVAGAARAAAIVDMTEQDWVFTVDLLQKGVFLGTKHAARLIRDSGRGGAIVNVASLAAHIPVFGNGAYATAKAGVEMFGKNAAIELAAFGIRVNTVLPGLVDTPMMARVLSDPPARADFLDRIPLGTAATPEQVAAPCLYLASADASYITGTSLVVDGGWEISNFPNLTGFPRAAPPRS